ncbi:hypothetical protein SeLEV6574_g03646 [Synchytrium endobioticum]|uniref:Uncharacterized protein n=1 Tax=Synchytrium endobioticum TaxID=286115 RepID=A0A507D2V4_9FUNG|nr:hypothetical protein SeLEV6574_g03646 [Synchytrium endobioticum]
MIVNAGPLAVLLALVLSTFVLTSHATFPEPMTDCLNGKTQITTAIPNLVMKHQLATSKIQEITNVLMGGTFYPVNSLDVKRGDLLMIIADAQGMLENINMMAISLNLPVGPTLDSLRNVHSSAKAVTDGLRPSLTPLVDPASLTQMFMDAIVLDQQISAAANVLMC